MSALMVWYWNGGCGGRNQPLGSRGRRSAPSLPSARFGERDNLPVWQFVHVMAVDGNACLMMSLLAELESFGFVFYTDAAPTALEGDDATLAELGCGRRVTRRSRGGGNAGLSDSIPLELVRGRW